MHYISKIKGKDFRISLLDTDSDWLVAEINGNKYPLRILKKNGNGDYLAQIGNRVLEFNLKKNDEDYLLNYKNEVARVSVEDEYLSQFKKFTNHAKSALIQKELKAPMPGLVIAIEAKPGQKVRKGDGLIVFEAMKMENEIKAPFDATIKEIKVSEKQAVEKDQLLIVFA